MTYEMTPKWLKCTSSTLAPVRPSYVTAVLSGIDEATQAIFLSQSTGIDFIHALYFSTAGFFVQN